MKKSESHCKNVSRNCWYEKRDFFSFPDEVNVVYILCFLGEMYGFTFASLYVHAGEVGFLHLQSFVLWVVIFCHLMFVGLLFICWLVGLFVALVFFCVWDALTIVF